MALTILSVVLLVSAVVPCSLHRGKGKLCRITQATYCVSLFNGLNDNIPNLQCLGYVVEALRAHHRSLQDLMYVACMDWPMKQQDKHQLSPNETVLILSQA